MNKFKYIINICLVLATTAVFAQTEKGHFLIGSSTQLSFTSLAEKSKNELIYTNRDNITNLNFATEIGYFIFENLVAGINLNYSYSKEVTSLLTHIQNEVFYYDTYTYRRSQFIPLLFIKYYLNNNKTKPYILLSSGYGGNKLKNKNEYENSNRTSENERSLRSFQYKLGTGASFIVSEKISFDIGINYIQSKTINKEYDETFSDVEFDKSVSISAGFSVYF